MGVTIRMPGLLNSALEEIARLTPSAGPFSFKYNAVSEATLTVPEDGPAVGMHSWVALYGLRGFLGVYRVTNVAQTVGRQIQLSLLHGIDILSDSVWEPASAGASEETFSGTMTQYITAILNHQTHLIQIGESDPVKPWVLGTCASSEVITDKKLGYNRLIDLLMDTVPEGGDYELVYDMSVFPWTVSMVAKSSAVAGEFRAAHNMSGVTITYNDADLCTRLALAVTSGGSSRVKIYNAGAIAQNTWGIVTKTASIDTNDTLSNPTWPEADAWAAAFFALHAQPSVQVQVEGEDLARQTGDTWDEAALGRMMRVPLPDYNTTVTARVVQVDYPDPYGQPERVTVSLANMLPQFTEQIRIVEKTANSAYGRAGAAAAKAEEADEKADEVIYRTDFTVTDRGIGMLAQAIGVKIDPQTHLPVYDEVTGQYAFEGNNGATLSGFLSVEASKVIAEVTTARSNYTELGARISAIAGDVALKAYQTDVDTQISTSASTTLTAAKDYAQARIAVDIRNQDGTVSEASIVAAVQDNSTLINAMANAITLSAANVSITGSNSLKLNNVIYADNSGALVNATGVTSMITDAGMLTFSSAYYKPTAQGAATPFNPVVAFDTPTEVNGKITIPYKRLTDSSWQTDVNFNIAATQTYIDGVAAAKSTALAGVTVSGWQPSNGANSAIQNLVKDGDNNLLHTITIPAQVTSGDGLYASVGSFNSSNDATVTIYPKIGGVSCAPIATATVNDGTRISDARAAGATAALQGVNLSGWQLSNSSTVNLVRDGNNNTLQTVSLPPSANWDINVGAFDSNGSATITVRNVFSGTYSNPVTTGTIADSNLQPGNIKDGVTIFGKTGTYTGSGGSGYFLGFSDQQATSGGEWYPYAGGTITGSKTIYAIIENSSGTPTTGSSITVSAPTQPTIGPKSTTITSNGTYYASDDSKNGWSQVTVSVSSSTYSHSAQTNQISTDQIYVYYQGTYMTYRQRYGTDRYVCYTTMQLGSTVYW